MNRYHWRQPSVTCTLGIWIWIDPFLQILKCNWARNAEFFRRPRGCSQPRYAWQQLRFVRAHRNPYTDRSMSFWTDPTEQIYLHAWLRWPHSRIIMYRSKNESSDHHKSQHIRLYHLGVLYRLEGRDHYPLFWRWFNIHCYYRMYPPPLIPTVYTPLLLLRFHFQCFYLWSIMALDR